MWRALPVIAAMAGLVGCGQKPSNATAEGAVREFCERLESFEGGDENARAIYELLSERSRANLLARAERYSNASGRKMDPWAMIVPARSRSHFVPQSYKARSAGKHALVEVLGITAAQRAQIPSVNEKGLWRVDIVFPELPPMPRRPGAL